MDDFSQQQWSTPFSSETPEESTTQEPPTEPRRTDPGASGIKGPLYPPYPPYPAYPPALPPVMPGGMPDVYRPPNPPGAGYPGNPPSPYYSGSTPSGAGWGGSLPPGYSAYSGMPPTLSAPSRTLPGTVASQRSSFLARRFPFWVSLLLTVVALVLVALVYTGNELILHGDWSSGARAAGIAALALAGATLLLLIVRLSMGRRGVVTILLSLLLALVLAAGGAGGLAYADPLHGIQAQTLERNGDWAGAVYEYELGGEKAPNAGDVARVYDEWGEQAQQQKDYKSAAARFVTVLTQYGQSGAPVDRARTDLFNTYIAWVQANDPAVPYSDAIAEILAYRSDPRCDATCQLNSRTVEAQARYNYGAQLLAQQQYNAAIQQFTVVQTQFPTSDYAKQAHLGAAQAYYAVGQQQLQNDCGSAIPTYQTLSKQYGDTPEGAKAKSALAAPQSVTGNISGFTDPTRIVYLSRRANIGTFYFSQDYHAGVDSKGNFTFPAVAQGNYNLSAASYTSGNYIYYPYWSDKQNLYFVQVGPLCPTQVGQLSFK